MRKPIRARSAETMSKILETSSDIFSRDGYDGTRVDEIAKVSGVNKASIYYHFQDKQKLYEHVLIEMLNRHATALEEQVAAAKGAEGKLRAFIDAYVGNMVNDRRISVLMMWEVASGGKNMPPSVLEQVIRLINLLSDILGLGEKEGVFHTSNPFMTYLMIVGSISYYIVGEPLRHLAASQKLIEDSKVMLQSPPEEAASIMTEMLLRSLRRENAHA